MPASADDYLVGEDPAAELAGAGLDADVAGADKVAVSKAGDFRAVIIV